MPTYTDDLSRIRQERDDKIERLVMENDRLSSREIGKKVGISHAWVADVLSRRGYQYQNGRWIKK